MGNSGKLIIVKLGGSVITYKDSPTPRARTATILRLSKELGQLHKKGYKLIVVHGSGSFGHSLSKKYKLTEGFITKNSIQGYLLTIASMTKLTTIILNCLNLNMPAIGFSPRSFITQTNGKLDKFDLKAIQKALDYNLVPVLHGDGVFDHILGCSILSGDTIIPYLAKKLKVEQVIFLSDVDGIFDLNPKFNKKAKLIKLVNNKNYKKVLPGLKESGRVDVSGEMLGKVLAIKNGLTGVHVRIANGLKKGNVTKIVQGHPKGTVIYFA